MPITADQAASIAKIHGLTLADAFGLAGLADNPEQANRIAARFAGTDDTVGREWVRELFGRADDTPTEAGGDGDTPTEADGDGGVGLRRFAHELFNQDP